MFGRNLSNRPLGADSNRALQFVGHFQHFALEIGIELRVSKKGSNLLKSLRAVLAADEGVEPSQEEEDLAVALDLGQGIQRRPQVGQGERRLIQGVERP